MPNGVMQWFDQAAGSGVVVSGNRRYAAVAADVESHARHRGARVHFDISSDGGVERAVGVVLRPGDRGSQHHHRFGTLGGARHPDSEDVAALERLHPELGRSVALHPLEVVRGWADALARGDLDAARSYYAPAAALHLPSDELAGQAQLSRWIEQSDIFSSGRGAEVRGAEAGIDASWTSVEDDMPSLSIRSRVEHGKIAEQWLLEALPAPTRTVIPSPAGPLHLAYVVSAEVEPEAVAYAKRRLGEVVGLIDEPILDAQMAFVRAPDPARRRPALVHVTLDVNGEPVRAHVAGHSMLEAVDLLEERLRDRIEHRAERRRALRRRTGLAEPGEWRRGDLPTQRPEYLDRPVEDRQLIRAKSFPIGEATVDEAIFDMEQLGYDFYLFQDLSTGLDATVERADDSYLLTMLGEGKAEVGASAYPLSFSSRPVPTLSVAEAIEQLNLEGVPFVSFINATSGRGNVCYRRYDGHYGLVAPN